MLDRILALGVRVVDAPELHASGHAMAVVIEPLRIASERIAPTAGAPTSVKRV